MIPASIAAATASAESKSNYGMWPASSSHNWSICVYWVTVLVSLIISSTQIFQGTVCYTNVERSSSGNFIHYEEQCSSNHMDPDVGAPDLELTSSSTSSAHPYQEYAEKVRLTGGWPKVNSIIHIAIPLFSFLVFFLIRKKNKGAQPMIWAMLATVWLAVTIVDSVTLSTWMDTCTDPTTAVKDIYGENGLKFQSGSKESIGDPSYLNNVVCSNGSYIALIITTSIACVAASANVCIARLSRDEDSTDSEDQNSYRQL